MKYFIELILFCIIESFFIGCKRFVEVPAPPNSIVGDVIYTNNASAASAVSGMFESMALTGTVTGGSPSITSITGLTSDELYLYPSNNALNNQAYSNSLLSTNAPPIWSNLYNYIYQANLIISGISNSMNVTDSLKRQYIGEAKFIRAFCYLYLVNLYGDVPLILKTDYNDNLFAAKSAKDKIYSQIVQDLKDAQFNLKINYVGPTGSITTDRVRPNIAAATALLARVYLYLGNWTDAESQATLIISNSLGTYNLGAFPSNIFAKTSTEAIWQLERPNSGINTADAYMFLPSSYGGASAIPFVFLSDSLANSFEPGDIRKSKWLISTSLSGKLYYSPYKYTLGATNSVPQEYPILLRLAEQYLIRAEARAQQNNIDGGKADLNVIRGRANLPAVSPTDKNSLLSLILKERRVELFTEWGHRWLDLKRMGKIDSVMIITTPLKGGFWDSKDAFYPIPFSDIQRAPNLTQTPGY